MADPLAETPPEDPLQAQVAIVVERLKEVAMQVAGQGATEVAGTLMMGAQALRVLWTELLKARAGAPPP